jgi:hypothetical protein
MCSKLRGSGGRYTTRFLPPYLISRSPFLSKNLNDLVAMEREGQPIRNDDACTALGCVDPRTARKQLLRVRLSIKAKTVALAAALTSFTTTSELPDFPPGTNAIAVLMLFWDRFLASLTASRGTLVAHSALPLLWLGPGFESFLHFNRSCIPIA